MSSTPSATALPSPSARSRSRSFSYSRTASMIDSIRESVPSSWRSFDMPTHLRHVDGTFTNRRNESLSYLALFPPHKTPLRGVVVYIHGLGVHCRRGFHIYEQLCESGFGILAYDLVGHGESDSSGRQGVRAHADKFSYFVNDTNEFVAFAKQNVLPQMLAPDLETNDHHSASTSGPRFPHLPMILIAASYGTLIALHTFLSERHTFAGVVLVSPAVMIEWRPLLRLQAFVVRPMAKLLPTFRGVDAAKPELICRDPAFLEDYLNDPLTVAAGMTLRMGAQSLKACDALQRKTQLDNSTSAVSHVPMLFLLGGADKVTSGDLAKRFFARLQSHDKQLHVFDGMFHALFDDPEKDEVFDVLIDWLHKRFPERDVAPVEDVAGGEAEQDMEQQQSKQRHTSRSAGVA